MKRKGVKVSDISNNPGEQLLNITTEDLMPLPYPYDKLDNLLDYLEENRDGMYG